MNLQSTVQRKESTMQPAAFAGGAASHSTGNQGRVLVDNRPKDAPAQHSPGVVQLVTVSMAERIKNLSKTSSLRGHVMYARDQRIATRKAAAKKRGGGVKKPRRMSPRDRFFTHTEGHYIKTLSKSNLAKRVHLDRKKKIMTHVLQGRLDMCKNCQEHMLPELQKKFPDYTHKVHYSFLDLQGSRTFWTKHKKKLVRKKQGNNEITRYNESQ